MVMKKTKDEETVDQNVLQKYHRGRQNRFKVSLRLKHSHGISKMPLKSVYSFHICGPGLRVIIKINDTQCSSDR